MKEIVQQYIAYNLWANQKMFEVMVGLPSEKQNKIVVSSFNGLQKTLLHIWNADSVWWQRLKLQEIVTQPGNENTSFLEILTGLVAQAKLLLQWVEEQPLAHLTEKVKYKNSRNEQFTQPVYEILMHVCNHATYHRGQVVTMLRQIGIENIPATDFSVFCRTKQQLL